MAVRFPLRIAGTGSVEPGRAVSTAEVAAAVTPRRDGAEVAARTGIASRRVANRDDTHAELAARALTQALEAAALPASALERIVFVTSGGGDMLFPANANVVARHLGLKGTCDCFDLNNACMGFLTALDLAARCIATGSGPIGIAVAELATFATMPADPRPYLVFGDGVAAAVVTPPHGDEGIRGVYLWNDGVAFGNVLLRNAVKTRRIETIQFTASNAEMGREAAEAVQRSARAVLDQAGMTLADVAWILPHQPTGALFEVFVATLGVPRERVVAVVHESGSIGAASIPLSLDRLFRTRTVRPGDHVLMIGVGGGLSSGAVLYRVGA